MELVGYFAAVLIGISLGLIGGGGSVLTVPLLYYIFGLSAEAATAWSLFIVGITSAVGSVAYFRRNEVDYKAGIVFGIPSIMAVFATRRWLLPAIPEHLLTLGETEITRDIFLIGLFAVLMIAASFSMIRSDKAEKTKRGNRLYNYPLILLEGIIVGTLTGLVGAGGGFLIIPALVVFSGLHMKKAIGTSLVIIAAKSLTGFTADAASIGNQWMQLITITFFAVAGVLLGFNLSKRVNEHRLKPAFGWFVLVMGICILVTEVIRL